jgi:hypothetical protein
MNPNLMDRIERRARLVAARRMGLVGDEEGLRLPDDLWRQAIPEAERELEAEALKQDHRLLHAVASSAARVRSAQRRYYKDRSRENMLDSKIEEASLDKLLKEAGYA